MPSNDTPQKPIRLSLREHLLTSDEVTPIAETEQCAPPLRSGPVALRPDPAALFSRVAVASMAAAMMFTGEAQGQNPSTPAAKPEKPKATATTSEPEAMPEVVVRGEQDSYRAESVSSPRYTEPLRDIPQTITVIPQAVIQEQGATTLRDVLRNVPGISIQAGEGGVPAGDNLSIRGFSARTDLFIDGVRDFGGYSRDPFNFEQVEVVKGPASAYAGRGSTGGSINLVTKAPKLESSYDASMGVGTENFKRGTIDLNQPISISLLGGTAMRFNAMWTEADVNGRDKVFNRRWGIAPSIAFGLNSNTQVTLSYSHLEQDNQPDYGLPWVSDTRILSGNPIFGDVEKPAPVKFSNYYGLTARDYEKTRTDLGTVEIKHTFNEHVSARYIGRYGRTSRDSIITAPRFLEPPEELFDKVKANPDVELTPAEREIVRSTDIERELKSRDQVDTILANQVDLTLKFDTWRFSHALVLGVDVAHETSENWLREGPEADFGSLYHPNPGTHYSGPVRRTGEFAVSTSDAVGLYAFDTIKLNEQWQINGGLRWDYFDVDATNKEDTVTKSLGRTDKNLSGRVALVYKPLPNGSIYAAYGTSFNPSAEGLTLSTSTNSLNPEKSRTYEIGTKWDLLDARLALTAAVFRTEKTNARTPGLTPDDPPTVLDGEQIVNGFEIGFAGSITRDWKVYGGYTFLDSEVEASNNPFERGKELSNTAQHSFSCWTTYSLPWKIEVGAGVQHVGARYANLTNTREAPGYWLFDVMVSYKINDHVSARLNVTNFADEEYIDRVGGGHFIPGPGRTAILTMNIDF